MPKLTRATKATLAKIARENGVTTEEVIAYIDALLAGKRVSKHSRLLTDSPKFFSHPKGV